MKWEERRLDIMKEINHAKFDQCKDYRDRLLNTGNAYLIEDTADPIWGRGNDGKGLNLLGHIHMENRKKLLQLQQGAPQQISVNIGGTLLDRTSPFVPRPRRNIYPPCTYCGESNHGPDRC